MLTTDLIRARAAGGKITPRFLDAAAKARLLPVARAYIDLYRGLGGESRETLQEGLDAVEVGARDRPIALGLQKLCEDRAEFAVPSGIAPETVRQRLFWAAAPGHREKTFDRAAIVAAAARELSATPAELEAALFADLPDNHRLESFRTLAPGELLERYDVSLVQALLLRATELVIECAEAKPAQIRAIFRRARFFGLLHTVSRRDQGYVFRFDGPLSLFEAAQRYGIKLAIFFPTILSLPRFVARATVRHGPKKVPLDLTIDQSTGLVAHEDPGGARPEIDALVRAFQALESDWKVAESDRVIALPGAAVWAPDLVFRHRRTGEQVLLELFGFWSRAAVFQRVELLQRGFPQRVILCVGKQLRVSEELLDDSSHGQILVYKTALSAKEVLARLERG